MCEDYDYEKFCCVCEKPIEAGDVYCRKCNEYLMDTSRLEEAIRDYEDRNAKEKFDTIHDDPYFIDGEVDIVEPEE